MHANEKSTLPQCLSVFRNVQSFIDLVLFEKENEIKTKSRSVNILMILMSNFTYYD